VNDFVLTLSFSPKCVLVSFDVLACYPIVFVSRFLFNGDDVISIYQTPCVKRHSVGLCCCRVTYFLGMEGV